MTPDLLRDLPILEPGHVWLAGAGPGDPANLTLLALAGLRQADVVIHDALVSAEILGFAAPDAERIDAGKRGGKPSTAQADITGTLIRLAREGRRVLRLKGGDPYVFGRGGEEALALAKAGIPFRIVPGLTAGLAGLAAAGIPATMRKFNQAIILATGHGADRSEGVDWQALARTGQPIVIYMAMTNLDSITRKLIEGGLPRDTPSAIVMAASTANQRVMISTLGRLVADALADGFGSPAIVVIGNIVAIRDQLQQGDIRP